jgi:hypothetical protein
MDIGFLSDVDKDLAARTPETLHSTAPVSAA